MTPTTEATASAARQAYQRLATIADALPDMDGVRPPEISGETIIMMATPTVLHERIVASVHRQITRAATGFNAYTTMGVEDPALGVRRGADITITTDADTLAHLNDRHMPTHAIPCLMEVVSPSNWENDWVGKLHDYAAMAIPVYVIADPRDGTVTVLTRPRPDGTWDARATYHFGDTVPVPGIGDSGTTVKLDTTGWHRYAA